MPFGGDNPFDDLEELLSRVSRELGPAGRGIDPTVLGAVGGGVAVDVLDREDEYVVTADLPGYERGEIDVSIREGTLRIEAERESETEEVEGDYLRQERRAASASRAIRLPGPVDEEAVTAAYTNGVLTVRLPTREPDEGGRLIEIE